MYLTVSDAQQGLVSGTYLKTAQQYTYLVHHTWYTHLPGTAYLPGTQERGYADLQQAREDNL